MSGEGNEVYFLYFSVTPVNSGTLIDGATLLLGANASGPGGHASVDAPILSLPGLYASIGGGKPTKINARSYVHASEIDNNRLSLDVKADAGTPRRPLS